MSTSVPMRDDFPTESILQRLIELLRSEPDARRALQGAMDCLLELPGVAASVLTVSDDLNPGESCELVEAGHRSSAEPSVLRVPLRAGEEELGVLHLHGTAPGVPPAAEDLPPGVVGLLALHLRATLQTMQLQRHVIFSRCSEQIVSRMAAGRPEAELFDALTRSLSEIFGLERVAAFTFSEDGRRLNPEAVYDARHAVGGGPMFPGDPTVFLDDDPALAARAREGRILDIPDVEAEGLPDHWKQLARDRRLGALLALPLADSRGPWALLVLGRDRTGPVLGERDGEVARTLVQQLAPLLQNSRVLLELQRNVESFRALLETSRELSAVLDLWEIPRRVALKGVQLTRADECVLLVLDDNGRTLRPVFAVSEEEEALMGRRVPLGQGLIGRVAEARRGEFVNREGPDGRELGVAGATASRLAVPLVCADELLGVLSLHRVSGPEFGDMDLAMATIFANQAAIALENARLFQRVKNERTRLATIIEQLEEAVLFSDADGVILIVNPAAYRWLRHPTGVEGAALLDLAPAGLRGELAAAMGVLRSGRERNITREMISGPRVDLVSLTAIHDARGLASGFVLLVKDISAMKAIESQLLQSSKMSAVGQLASGVAHEFNNLIAAIYGYAQLMRDNPDERIHRRGIEVILSSSERARRLTGNLLSFSRDRGDQAHAVDLNELLEETLQLVEGSLTADQVRVVRDTGALELTWAQRGPLQEVLLNLVTNACHAIRERSGGGGGTLTLRTRQEAEWLILEVADDGVGIPADHQARIFEPFFTTKGPLGGQAIPGTGLGLFTVYNVVTAHGGRIDVESEPGQGATFRIRLPLRRQKTVPHAA